MCEERGARAAGLLLLHQLANDATELRGRLGEGVALGELILVGGAANQPFEVLFDDARMAHVET